MAQRFACLAYRDLGPLAPQCALSLRPDAPINSTDRGGQFGSQTQRNGTAHRANARPGSGGLDTLYQPAPGVQLSGPLSQRKQLRLSTATRIDHENRQSTLALGADRNGLAAPALSTRVSAGQEVATGTVELANYRRPTQTDPRRHRSRLRRGLVAASHRPNHGGKAGVENGVTLFTDRLTCVIQIFRSGAALALRPWFPSGDRSVRMSQLCSVRSKSYRIYGAVDDTHG